MTFEIQQGNPPRKLRCDATPDCVAAHKLAPGEWFIAKGTKHRDIKNRVKQWNIHCNLPNIKAYASELGTVIINGEPPPVSPISEYSAKIPINSGPPPEQLARKYTEAYLKAKPSSPYIEALLRCKPGEWILVPTEHANNMRSAVKKHRPGVEYRSFVVQADKTQTCFIREPDVVKEQS